MARAFAPHLITDDRVLGGKEIERSLVFNAGSNTYLTRDHSVAGNKKQWTFSCWIKRSELGGSGFNAGEMRIFGGDTNASHIYIQGGETLTWDMSDGTGTDASLVTNRFLRDHLNWFHLVCALDTDESTANNRMRMYINGVEETAFNTRSNPSQGFSTNRMNNDGIHSLGRRTSAQGSDGMRFDGYMAEVQWIDGQQLDPSYFGYTDFQTGIWRPKKYEGTYGTNGFHLDFSDTTSTTTLGYDKSGNNNHWTPNDFVTGDALLDTPTNNFATLVMMGTGFSSGAGFNEGNRKVTTGSSGGGRYLDRNAISSYTFNKGKWYAEIRTDSGNYANKFIGVAPWQLMVNPESNNNKYCYIYTDDGNRYLRTAGSESNATYGGPSGGSNGDIIGIFIDMDASTPRVYFSENGQWANGSGAWNQASPSAYVELGDQFFTEDIDRNLVGYCGFSICSASGGLSQVMIANFGQDSTFAGTTTAGGFKDSTGIGDFKYAVPSGALALCSKNLTRLNKERGTACKIINPKRHFDVLTYTGDGSSSNTITGLQFKPDMVWIKGRSGSTSHVIQDVVRGNFILYPDTDQVEGPTGGGWVKSFNEDGFTTDSNGPINTNGATYVAWCWKAGGAPVTNNDGSIATSISANQEAGFSIVTWTGNGSAGATLGHGLGKKPKMIIVKRRAGGTQDWFMDVGEIENQRGGRYWRLKGSVSPQTNTDTFPNTSPTSTVFSVGSDDGVNASGSTYVAYVWTDIPGYSAFGTYRGNGDTDGQYITTGFKPRYVMTKRSAVDGWSQWDTQRSGGHNLIHNRNGAGYNNAESTGISNGTSLCDFYGNGFKWRGQSNDTNGDGDNYVYMCFAEESFTTPYFAAPTAR
tara:strand:- start:422 stop:3010 length:2589 start_codon:yes stop_codon:yes gene_type:complete